MVDALVDMVVDLVEVSCGLGVARLSRLGYSLVGFGFSSTAAGLEMAFSVSAAV